MQISAGKLWSMRRLADERGFFKMTAVDQRPGVEALVRQRRGAGGGGGGPVGGGRRGQAGVDRTLVAVVERDAARPGLRLSARRVASRSAQRVAADLQAMGLRGNTRRPQDLRLPRLVGREDQAPGCRWRQADAVVAS